MPQGPQPAQVPFGGLKDDLRLGIVAPFAHVSGHPSVRHRHGHLAATLRGDPIDFLGAVHHFRFRERLASRCGISSAEQAAHCLTLDALGILRAGHVVGLAALVSRFGLLAEMRPEQHNAQANNVGTVVVRLELLHGGPVWLTTEDGLHGLLVLAADCEFEFGQIARVRAPTGHQLLEAGLVRIARTLQDRRERATAGRPSVLAPELADVLLRERRNGGFVVGLDLRTDLR